MDSKTRSDKMPPAEGPLCLLLKIKTPTREFWSSAGLSRGTPGPGSSPWGERKGALGKCTTEGFRGQEVNAGGDVR